MYRYLISSLNLILVILCCVYLDAVEVLGIFILALFGVSCLIRHVRLKYMLTLQLYIFLFSFRIYGCSRYWHFLAL